MIMQAGNENDSLKYSMSVGQKSRLTSHIYLIYWDIHEWTTKKWAADGWSEINTDHLKLITLVAREINISNKELAKHVGVTKQAMSQMVTTLEKRGVLNVITNPTDSRAKQISLSDYGVEFLKYFNSSIIELMKEYTKVIGEDKMKIATEILAELSDNLTTQKFGG